MKFKIRGHHLEELASDLKWNRDSYLIDSMRANPQEKVVVINTYDDFCKRICKLKCDENKENLPNWDKAFTNLNGFELNRSYSAEEFLNKMQNMGKERRGFATSDVVMECGQNMTYDEILEYLSEVYFDFGKLF